jgi:hypothetical protein
MGEIDIIIDKEDIGVWVKLSIEDVRNVYKISVLGSDKYRVRVSGRKLSLFERYRLWRLERHRKVLGL